MRIGCAGTDALPRRRGRIDVRTGAALCLLLAFLAASIAGCAGAKPREAANPAFLSHEAAVDALLVGVDSLAGFRRERVVAESQKRPPDYAPARKALGDALATLRPADTLPSPGYERAAIALETAQVAMDRIIEATRRGDGRAEEVGWEIFDQSVGDLLLAMPRGSGAP